MSPRVNVKPVTEQSLVKKLAISYIFMSLVPIIFILLIIYFLKIVPILQQYFPYYNLTIFLLVLLSLVCFYLVRRSIKILVQFSGRAREIADGKYYKRIDLDEKDEIGVLAESFNKITGKLEAKIKELEASKALLQEILQKIGVAVTSTKGIENLLELIIQSLVKGAEATSGAIFLLSEKQDELILKISFGMERSLEKIDLEDNQGLISTTVGSKRLSTASDISKDTSWSFEFNSKLARDSMIVCPLLYKGELLGVITMSDKKGEDSFNNDDKILLTNVAAQTAVAIKNFQLNEDAEKTYFETITALAVAVEAKDPYSRGHLDRVANYVERLGHRLRLDEETIKVLRSGAILHDIGKIGIRDEILRKKGPLTEDEEKEMREHAIIGVNIIKPIRSMAALYDLVYYHQEWYDGSGYPDRLKGEEIPLVARILKVCDAYDAMTTNRPYRKGMSKEEARQELRRKSGIEFDPKIVEEFLTIIDGQEKDPESN